MRSRTTDHEAAQENTGRPLIRIIVMTYALLSLLMIPLGILLIIRVIPQALRALRAAADAREKAYWRLNLLGYLLVAYGAVLSGSMMLDDFRGEPWRLSQWWPSLSLLWFGARHHAIAVLLDLLIVLAAGLALICAARCFGHVDEDGVWRGSEWMRRGRGAGRR